MSIPNIVTAGCSLSVDDTCLDDISYNLILNRKNISVLSTLFTEDYLQRKI